MLVRREVGMDHGGCIIVKRSLNPQSNLGWVLNILDAIKSSGFKRSPAIRKTNDLVTIVMPGIIDHNVGLKRFHDSSHFIILLTMMMRRDPVVHLVGWFDPTP